MLKKIAILLLLLMPVAALALYKPAHVLAPELFSDVHCIDSELCLEDTSRYDEARKLYNNSLQRVASIVGDFRRKPRVIFCSTDQCYHAFSRHNSSAITVGRWGIVVSPRGRKGYYLRHEMIHHRQAEELGVLAVFTEPEWLIEGMAYALSDDPRAPLADRWEEARQRFREWYNAVGRNGLWRAAKAQ